MVAISDSCNSNYFHEYDIYVSSQYNGYINITDKQINKGCSIEFLSARTILTVCI
jgi:hydroxymethylpyrimidine pyrophosphatase-like HAD family hydrolase